MLQASLHCRLAACCQLCLLVKPTSISLFSAGLLQVLACLKAARAAGRALPAVHVYGFNWSSKHWMSHLVSWLEYLPAVETCKACYPNWLGSNRAVVLET